ncbi:hypothetical protein GE061_005714 [Apolygus lucorum]|uniref:Uncharacterized protein n=1 Tax=Apolygus lucorum TaxID=248454 RepID=A0A8S9WX16_APOLU|nr:hypothetical protein GE061_005714 [Apolygus lucorum]
MLLLVVFLLTSATGAHPNEGRNELPSLLGEMIKVIIFGGPVDQVAQRIMYDVNSVKEGVSNYLENNPLDENSTRKLEEASESIARGIDTILEELHLFKMFPAIEELYDSQIRIVMRIVLAEAVKILAQLRGIPLHSIGKVVFNA